MPAISVIIPVYNTEKYLCECLDSVLAQTFTDFELILIDDGSTDSSPAICDAYAARDHRVRVFRQENQGQAAARNFGVTQAKAEWIAFVDGDDVLHTQYLEALYGGTVENGADLSMCNDVKSGQMPADFHVKKNPEKAEIYSVDEDSLLYIKDRTIDNYYVVWGKLIRKSIVEQLPMKPGRIYEDCAVVCKWLLEAGLVAWTQKELYYYRIEQKDKAVVSSKQIDKIWADKERMLFYKNLGYSKLLSIETQAYMMHAAGLYYTYKKNSEFHLCRSARQDFIETEREFKKYFHLQEDEEEYVLAAFHPHRLRIYILQRKLKEYGPAGFARRAIQHIIKR